jgi:hypothetical protein
VLPGSSHDVQGALSNAAAIKHLRRTKHFSDLSVDPFKPQRTTQGIGRLAGGLGHINVFRCSDLWLRLLLFLHSSWIG